jgi:threonine 3-dehydrogenase
METMWAVRKRGPAPGLALEEVSVPAPADDEVLVEVEAASVCGTDLHIFRWDAWARHRISPPLTLGHEFAGTVVALGRNVRHVAEGDYVSAESHVTCGACYHCRTGRAHMCEQTQILGVDRNGAFAQYVVEHNEGEHPDVVFEMSGAREAIVDAFRIARNGGRVILFGIPAQPVELDVAEELIFKNLNVSAVSGREVFATWYKTRWLLEHGVVDLRPLITEQLGLTEFDRAFALLESGEACKIVLRPNGAPNEALIATPVGAVEADGNLARLERWAHR